MEQLNIYLRPGLKGKQLIPILKRPPKMVRRVCSEVFISGYCANLIKSCLDMMLLTAPVLPQVSGSFQSSSAQLEPGHFLRPDSSSMLMIPMASAANSWTNNVQTVSLSHVSKGFFLIVLYQ